MVVQRWDSDDLVTLPACREHGTLPPVVDIDRLCIERLVIAAAVLANLLINSQPVAFIMVVWVILGCLSLVIIVRVLCRLRLGSMVLDVAITLKLCSGSLT